MLRYLYADELSRFPTLAHTMFRDRARQFSQRHGWEVTVNDRGEERDDYDDENPLYVIWETENGTHGGSMRFLPTTGRTMIEDHFLDLTDDVSLKSPFIWECTRFCLAPVADSRTAAALMLGGLELGLGQGLSHAIGVFDAPMCRVYRRLGWEPTRARHPGRGPRRDLGRAVGVRHRAPPGTAAPRAGLVRPVDRLVHAGLPPHPARPAQVLNLLALAPGGH